MAEHIDYQDVFGSGGHRWTWGDRPSVRKRLATTRTSGEAQILLHTGALPGRVDGVLKASGAATRAAADQALDALEADVRDLETAGVAVEWEDDAGHSGEALVLERYSPQGPRVYGYQPGETPTWQAWQFYSVSVRELEGGWA